MLFDVFVVVCFVILLFCISIIYNRIMLNKYKNMKNNIQKIPFTQNFESEIPLYGVDIDANGDYMVEDAIGKIDLPEEARICVDEKR